MAIPFYSDIDLNNNKIKNFTVDTLDQAPTNPNKGQQYYNTTDNKLYYWNGTEWVTGSASASSVGDTLPIGSTLEWFSTTIPDNWLVCDGSAVSRTTYSDLFAVIGTTFGEGDGSTTFNLPNTKGRTIVGLNADDADFNTIGKTIGEKTHTLTVAEMPKHNHKNPIDSFVNSDWQVDSKSGGHVSYKAQGENYETTSAGGSQPHNNIQPSFIGVYIIKAKQSAGLVATVVDNLTSTSSTNALSANQGKTLNEKIDNAPKLIYTKVTSQSDANGFDINGITLEPNKNYQISFVGNMTSTDTGTLKNIFIEFNDVTPTVRRSVIFGSEGAQLKNSYSTDSLRLIRGWSGFGTMSDINLIFKGNYIRTIGKYSCTAYTFETSINTTINSMIGPFDSITKISVTPETGVTLDEQAIIKIYELP